MVSALIGQPPNGEEDYLIVKGIMRRIGLEGLDPAKGILIPPARPVNDQYRSRGPGILAGDSVCIFLIVLITGARLLIRAFYRGLQWGWDDWLILLASVSPGFAEHESRECSDGNLAGGLVLVFRIVGVGSVRWPRETHLGPDLS